MTVAAFRPRKTQIIGTQTTWVELVRIYLPNATEAQADYLLWERTCFPMGSIGTVARQLQEAIINGRITTDLVKFGV